MCLSRPDPEQCAELFAITELSASRARQRSAPPGLCGQHRRGGNTAATIGGAAVGGLAGNAIGQRTREGGADTYRVGVRYDNGGSQYIDVPHPGDLRTGDRVRVDGNQISRY